MEPVIFRDHNKKAIKGVSCSVNNCEHHDGKTHCVADSIAVGPASATECCDTLCATFKKSEGQDCHHKGSNG